MKYGFVDYRVVPRGATTAVIRNTQPSDWETSVLACNALLADGQDVVVVGADEMRYYPPTPTTDLLS